MTDLMQKEGLRCHDCQLWLTAALGEVALWQQSRELNESCNFKLYITFTSLCNIICIINVVLEILWLVVVSFLANSYWGANVAAQAGVCGRDLNTAAPDRCIPDQIKSNVSVYMFERHWPWCVLGHQGKVCWGEDPNSGGGSRGMYQTAAHHLLWCQRSSRWGAANTMNKQECVVCTVPLILVDLIDIYRVCI